MCGRQLTSVDSSVGRALASTTVVIGYLGIRFCIELFSGFVAAPDKVACISILEC